MTEDMQLVFSAFNQHFVRIPNHFKLLKKKVNRQCGQQKNAETCLEARHEKSFHIIWPSGAARLVNFTVQQVVCHQPITKQV